MKVAQLVRRTLGVTRHRVVRVTEQSGHLVVDLDLIHRRRLPCSGCGTFAVVRDRLRQRSWRHVPCWGIPVVLRYRPARVRCDACGIRVEAIPWSAGQSPIALPMVVTLATWARMLAWDVVGQLFGVSWATVTRAVEVAVDHGLGKRDLSGLRFIGIDEISRKKRHVYHTNSAPRGAESPSGVRDPPAIVAAEALSRCGHVQGLMGTSGVVVADPRIQRCLS